MKTNFKAAKLAACFMQRAGSKLRGHVHTWRLRKHFEVASIHVDIPPAALLADVHAMVKGFTVVLVIGALRQEFPLYELVAYKAPGALGMIQTGTRYLVECADSRVIKLQLSLTNPGKTVLTPRSDGGRGFEITIELHGHKLCQNEGETRSGPREKKIHPAIPSRR